jgi:shikimate kinase
VQKEEIFKRISDIKERGVVLFDSQSLDDMYLERIGLYEKYADITLKEEGCSIEDTVQAIVAQI